jgi:hypothetical protein
VLKRRVPVWLVGLALATSPVTYGGNLTIDGDVIDVASLE